MAAAAHPAGEERSSPIGVGAVGVRLDDEPGIAAELPEGELFRLVAFSDEGLPPVPRRREADEPTDVESTEEADADPAEPSEAEVEEEVAYYPDYNVLLQDPAVEMVLVDGPAALRRDFAVRALNAGRHVVLAPPFAETAPDGERIAKTAARRGLVATMNAKWRDDADLRALLAALQGENVAAIQGALLFHRSAGERGPNAAEPGASTGLLDEIGVALLDQMHVVLRQDIKAVSAHLQRPAQGKPDYGFLLYMPLRNGGWAICQATALPGPEMPRWALYAAQTTFAVRDGKAVATTPDGQRTYDASAAAIDFWRNVHDAIREGAELKCHPADIVRAMKWHEAAQASDELREAVNV